MKSIYALIPLGLLAASPALAQPILPPVDSPNQGNTLPDDPEDPTATQEPPPTVVQDPPPVMVVAPAQTAPPAEPAPQRPTAFSIGLGFGYVIPSDLSSPNITSARLRLPSGLTFEPTVVLGHEGQTEDDGTVSTELSINEVEVALGVRFPLISNGRIDFSLVGAAGVSLTTINPEGDDNNRKINSFGVGWGIALDYWLTQHWDLSFTASNPILVTSSVTQEEGPGLESSDSTTTFGAVFDPTLAVMIHLHL